MDCEKEKKEVFKELCSHYLGGLSLIDLRNYGRFLNLPAPTNRKKAELVCEIISVLCGEQQPVRSKRGAPIKNNCFHKDIISSIEEIKAKCFNRVANFSGRIEGREEKIEGSAVVLHFSIVIEKLNGRQRQLLQDFLNSL